MGTKKFYETDTFKSTQEEWYSKLKTEGFEDIEKGETEDLIQPQIFTAGKINGGLDHYQYCQAILNEPNFFPANFKGDLHRAIFELYSEGKTLAEIHEWTKTQECRPLTRMRISQIISEIKERYGRR